MQNEDWVNSEWYKKWVKMTYDKPKQLDIGYWYFDNEELCWKFEKSK